VKSSKKFTRSKKMPDSNNVVSGRFSTTSEIDREQYRALLREAQAELLRLLKERERLDIEIVQTKKDINACRQLLRMEPLDCTDHEYAYQTGIAALCRQILAATDKPLTAKQVRSELVALGHDISRYSNVLATISSCLNRVGLAVKLPGARSKAWLRKPQ
jgi:hypothetical protein